MTEQALQTLGSIATSLKCIVVLLVLILLSIPGKTAITEALLAAMWRFKRGGEE
jgi:hypothetical protein